jgi:GDSL-like Lipase/Acylhydrolase family
LRSIRNGGTQILNIAAASTVNAYPAAQWHCACYTYSEADSAKVNVYGDGCFYISGNPSGAPSASDPAGPLRVGLDVDLTGAFALGGSVAAVVLYNRVLSASERRQVQNYLAARYGWPVGNVACLGDSITQGTNVARPYPTSLASRLGAMWRVQNFGANGARIDVGGTDVNDAQWLHSTAGARRRAFNFIVVNVGINDIRNDYSAANCYTDLQTIYNSVLADPDNRLIACTVTPFKGDTAYTAGREAERITLNDSIRGFVAANANS